MRASAPQRSSATVTLGFGAISIPCSLYSGTSEHGVKRHEYVRDEDGRLHKVGRRSVNLTSGDEVARSEIVKLIDTDEGPVELTDEEIEQHLGSTPKSMTIEAFLPQAVLGAGRYIPERLMQVRPAKVNRQVNPMTAKAFATLLRGLRKTQTFALVHVTQRGTPRYGALLPNGKLYLLRFDEEVREDLPLDLTGVSDSELDVMVSIIESQASNEVPELTDEATAAVLDYAIAKASGADVDIVAPAAGSTGTGSVESLLDQLQASIVKKAQ